MADKMKPTVILAKIFRKENQPLGDFAREVKALSPEEKHELAALGAEELGVELDES